MLIQPNEKDFLRGEEFTRILSFNYQTQKCLRNTSFKDKKEMKAVQQQFKKMNVVEVIDDFDRQVRNDQKIIGDALTNRFIHLKALDMQDCVLDSEEIEKVQGFMVKYFPSLRDVFMTSTMPLLIPID